MTDFLDDILEPQKRADNRDRKGGLCVGVRARDSSEIEQREKEYLATDWLPIPFCTPDGTLARDLMEADVKQIKAWCGLGLTMDEYEQLMCGESK
jgi:hypothetical protein